MIFPIWNEAVLGHLELALGDAQAAAGHLRALPYRLISLGWNDPADSLWPDAIEALVDLGELEEAGRYLESYETLAQRSSSVWALATAARCRGLLAAANGDFDAAFDAFDRALAQHDRMPGRFERGRTLLSYGTARRRARERGAARRALEAALEISRSRAPSCGRGAQPTSCGASAGDGRLVPSSPRPSSGSRGWLRRGAPTRRSRRRCS